MRSLGFTLILALLAILASGLAGWQWTQGNFDSVFGAPPTPVGKRIYDDFAPAEVKFIRVAQAGVSNQFELGPDGWQCVAPWKDRMDPRAAVEIINFTLGMRVEDAAPIDEIDQPVPTVFVLPRDPDHRHYIYSCTGDITPLFRDGLKYLRDYRPLYF